MLDQYRDALVDLENRGWKVNFLQPGQDFPIEAETRYSWVPADVRAVISELDFAVGPDKKAWILGISDFLNISTSAFKWNEWEQLSIEAADGNPNLTQQIKHFWDMHFPIAHSVKSGYAYFAVRKENFSIVCGEEPEFEDSVRVIATSFLEFLQLCREPNADARRWI